MLFFSFISRFWFGVEISARDLVRAEKFFLCLEQGTVSVWPKQQRFEAHCVQMARAAARVRSLYATSARHHLRNRLVKRSRQRGKKAARLRCLLPMHAGFRYSLWAGYPPQ